MPTKKTDRFQRIFSLLLAAQMAFGLIAPSLAVANAPTIADAGPDRTVEEEILVGLEGRDLGPIEASETVTFSWSQLSGPAVTLSDANIARPAFTAPSVDTTTVLTFELTVDDGRGGASKDTVDLKVTNSLMGKAVNVSATFGNSGYQDMAVSKGNVFVAWSDRTFGSLDILFKKSRDGGQSFRSPVRLSGESASGTPATSIFGDSFYPQIAVFGNKVYVAWDQVSADTSVAPAKRDVYIAASDDNGDSFGAPVRLSQGSTADSWDPQIAASDTYVHVLWYQGGSGLRTASRRHDAPNELGSYAFTELANAAKHRSERDLAAYQNKAYAVWGGVGGSTGPSEVMFANIYANLAGGAGTTVTVDPLVNVSNSPQPSFYPSIAMQNGNVYVAWNERFIDPGPTPSADPARDDTEVFFSRKYWTSSSFNAAVNMSNTPMINSRAPRLASARGQGSTDNKVYLAWTEESNYRSPYERSMIVFRNSVDSGWTFGAAQDLGPPGVSGYLVSLLDLAAEGDNVYAAWEKRVAGAEDVFISVSTDKGSSFKPQINMSNNAGASGGPVLAASGGLFYAAWMDNTTSNWEVLLRAGSIDNDLALSEMVPVQTIYDPMALVKDKKTVVKVKVKNGFAKQIETELELKVESATGTVLNKREAVSLPPGSLKTFHLPLGSGRILPADDATFTVTIDPDDTVLEPKDTTGSNTVEVGAKVKDTKPLRILYVPVKISLDGKSPPTASQMSRFRLGGDQFITGTYPIAESEYKSGINPLYQFSTSSFDASDIVGGRLTIKGQFKMYSALDKMVWFSSYDKVIGVVRDGWHRDLTEDTTGAVGTAWPGVNFAVAEQKWFDGVVAAHEIAHTYGAVLTPSGDASHAVASGVGRWVSRGEDMIAYDFMYPSVPGFGEERWIGKDNYDYIMQKLLENPADPPVIGISGMVSKSGTVELNPWYRFDSILDVPLDNPGDIRVVYLDGSDNQLAETGFDVSYQPPADGGGPELDDAAFSQRIPDVPGTRKILLKRGGVTLAERAISAGTPDVTVTVPNGGEKYLAEETVTVAWEGSDPDGDPLSYIVSLSLDGGDNWTPVELDTTATTFSFQTPRGTRSDSALVKVVGTDGVNTGEDISDATFTIEPALPAPGGEHVLSWARQIGTESYDYGYGAAVFASDGSLYIAGDAGDALPGQISSGGADAFIRKYDSSGNETWTRQFGTADPDHAYALGVDTTGNVAVVGGMGPWAYARKYDSSGNELWTRQFGGSYFAAYYAPLGAAVDSSGSVYLGGSYWNGGTQAAFVKKYDADGNELWTRAFGGFGSAGGVAVDSNNYVYLAGETMAELPGQTSAGGTDAFVRKYDPAGNEVWTRQFGTSSTDRGHAVAVDSSDNLYVGGSTFAALPGQTALGDSDLFVRKYDFNGNELWTRQFGTSEPEGYGYSGWLAVDSNDSVYVAGHTPGALPGQTSSGGVDAFVMRYDADGNAAWTKQFSADYTADVFKTTRANALTLSSSDDLYIVGATTGAMPGQAWSGQFDAFVAKFSAGAGSGPVVTAADLTVDEGGPVPISADFKDGNPVEHTATIDWGDGAIEAGEVTETAGAGTVSGTHHYADDGGYAAKVSISGAGGPTAEDTFTVTVNNVAPDLVAPDYVNLQPAAGMPVFLAGVTFADPGWDDTHTAEIDWGDGAVTTGTISVTDAGGPWKPKKGTVSGSHTYAAPGAYPIEVRLADDDGGTATVYGITAEVSSNQPPTADAGGPYAAYEGEQLLLGGAGSTDPEMNMLSHEWRFKGRAFTNPFQPDSSQAVTSADDYSGEAALTVDDGRGGTDEATAAVVFNNLPPAAEAAADQAVSALDQLILTAATFTDAGKEDTHSAVIDWGDGSMSPGQVTETAGSGEVLGSHTYALPGVYAASVLIADDDGGTATVGFNVTVAAVRDAGAPTGSIIINQGARYTKSLDVTLGLTANDPQGNPISVRFKNDGGAWSQWEAFASIKTWRLPPVQGDRRVWAQFKDSFDNISGAASDTIFLDTMAPKGQKIKSPFLLSKVTARRAIKVAWSATDAAPSAGLRYDVQLRRNSAGAWTDWKAGVAVGRATLKKAAPGTTYYFRARGRDGAGNVGEWSAPAKTIVPFDQDKLVAKRRGFIHTESAKSSRHWLGTVRYSIYPNYRAQHRFTGDSVYLISTLGPGRGAARIYVDGVFQKTVDTLSDRLLYRRVIFSKKWKKAGTHTLTVINQGTPGRPRFDLDGLGVGR